ncbi:MAG: D-2-hydroxyacid dehydrogenase [Lachnospiraceae bacterium]|nr:D-2-hydroxyacid dehydrogenase [Lachnospiraceae bacterium]
MNIIFLDRKTIGDDIDLKKFETFGRLITFDFTYPDEAPDRVKDADILIVNKVPMNEQTLGSADHLKLICVTATGINNLDLDYLGKRGIAWRNVAGYSTESVAQLTFSLLFYLWEHMAYYDRYVKSGEYVGDRTFSHFENTFREINGKNWGIIGLGAIGHRVAQIASTFGAHVQYFSTSGIKRPEPYPEVDFDTLLSTSDILSLHCPLTAATEGLINADALGKMKEDAILLNLSRGPVVDEAALDLALEQHHIGGAGLDVLSAEPMTPDNPLLRIKDSDRLIITPHIGWAGVETRLRLMDTIYAQIEDFIKGNV